MVALVRRALLALAKKGDAMSESELPTISVVTPSYQQAQYLEMTIQSVIAEDYPNLEYIVIDGGSTDRSLEIIRRYSKHLSYYVSEPDGGQADAIRKGFDRASGEIFAWLNADDTYMPGGLRKVGHFFVQNPDVGLMYGDYNLIDAEGEILERKRQPSFDLGIAKYAYMTIPQQSAFWREEVYRAVGGIDTTLKFSMDYDLFLKMAQVTKVEHLPGALGNFRFHQDSKTSRMQDMRRSEEKIIRERYCRVKPSSIFFFATRAFYMTKLMEKCAREGCLWEKAFNQVKRRRGAWGHSKVVRW